MLTPIRQTLGPAPAAGWPPAGPAVRAKSASNRATNPDILKDGLPARRGASMAISL